MNLKYAVCRWMLVPLFEISVLFFFFQVPKMALLIFRTDHLTFLIVEEGSDVFVFVYMFVKDNALQRRDVSSPHTVCTCKCSLSQKKKKKKIM